MIKKNQKMEAILKNYNTEDYNICAKCKKIVQKTKLIHDCVLYCETGDLRETDINFDFVLNMYRDWTGFEASNNEILIGKEVFSNRNMKKFIQIFVEELEKCYPDRLFCIIITYGNIPCLRFHTYRAEEGFWLSEEIEDYAEGILHVIPDKVMETT